MKSEELTRECTEIANKLEAFWLKVFQAQKQEDKEDIDYVDDRLFKLQSEIRDISAIIENMFFWRRLEKNIDLKKEINYEKIMDD